MLIKKRFEKKNVNNINNVPKIKKCKFFNIYNQKFQIFLNCCKQNFYIKIKNSMGRLNPLTAK